MDGAVTVLLSESDNDYGIAAQVRSSEKITDGRYINVYESVEERELSESIKDIWMKIIFSLTFSSTKCSSSMFSILFNGRSIFCLIGGRNSI